MTEQQQRAAHAFIEKMKTRDMRVPILEDFRREEMDFDIDAMANMIADKDLGLDFLQDSLEAGKIEALARKMLTEPFSSMEADNQTKIRIMTIISSVFLSQAIKQTNDTMRDSLFRELKGFFQRADKIKVSEKATLALKGFYFFFNNEIKQSVDYFGNARDADNVQFVPAIIGRGCLEFARRKYHEARDLFREAIRANPNGPYQLRIALSLCYFQLEEFELAKLGYESVLRKHPACSEALIGLAVIAKRQNNLKEYYEKLEAVFRAQPFHTLANIYLAEHYFYKREFERAEKLIASGLQNIDLELQISNPGKKDTKLRIDMTAIKSKYLYMQGFIYHETEPKLDLAAQYYKQAVDANPENAPALFGLAQVHLAKQSFEDSIACFESIVRQKAEHEASDCFRIDKKELAKRYYELALKYHPHDVELLIEYATYIDTLDVREGLKHYKKAILNYDSNKETLKPRPELFNNYAVTLIKNRDFDEAERNLNRAQAENTDNDPAIDTFVKFNKAYLLEQRGDFDTAKHMYVELVKTNPLFTDPMYRLASIYHSRGDLPTAMAICDQAIAVLTSLRTFQKIDIAFSLKSAYLIEEKEFEKAINNIKKLEEGLAPQKDGKPSIDPYGSLLKAQAYYLISVGLRSKVPDQKSNLQKVAFIAKEVLSRKKDSTNMFAGMATAAVLAERGGFKEATEILQLCQESCPNNPKVQYNLALLEYLKGGYEKSFTILVSFMKKNPDVFNEQVMTLFAINNLMLNNPKDAQRQFQRMLLMYPHKHEYLFNLGVFMQDYVMKSFKLNKRDQQQIELTQTFLKLSKKFLSWLDRTLRGLFAEKLRYPDSYSDEKKARVHLRYIAMSRTIHEGLFFLEQNNQSFQMKIEEDKKQFEVEHQTVQQRKKVHEDLEAKKREQQVLEEHERMERELELEHKARMDMELANELHKMRILQKKEIEAKKTRTKQRNYEDDNGQLPTLNFGKHADDDEHEHFEDFGTSAFSKIDTRGLKDSATKRKKTRGNGSSLAEGGREAREGKLEGKSRLKKPKLNTKADASSDENLDVVDDEHEFIPPLEDEEEEVGPSKKVRKSRPEEEEDNNQMDEEAVINFAGDDDDENEF